MLFFLVKSLNFALKGLRSFGSLARTVVDLFYLLVRLGPRSDIRALRYLRGIEYHILGREKSANRISKLILSAPGFGADQSHTNDVFDAVIGAAYSGDTGFLRLIEQRAESTGIDPGLRSYVGALADFGEGQECWAEKLVEAKKLFFESHTGTEKPIPEWVEHAANYFPEHEFEPELQLAFSQPVNPTFQPRSGDTIVLISCTLAYLEIFSEWFVKQLRARNSNPIAFLVVVASQAEKERVETLRRRLTRSGSISISIQEYGNLAEAVLASSLLRFTEAARLMENTGYNLAILDIDMVPDFDVDRAVSALQSPFSFIQRPEVHVPWARLNAGFCVFKASYESVQFLRGLRRYMLWAVRRGGNWTLDQAALHLVWRYWARFTFQEGLDDTARLVPSSLQIAAPRKLSRAKVSAKSSRKARS